MAESRVAYRYAKALIELAQEKNVLEQVHTDMQFFVQTIDGNRSLHLMLQSPIVPHAKKYNVMRDLFQTRLHPITFSIFEIITRKNREEVLYSVAKAFHELYNKQNNIYVAHVTTTFPLDERLRSNFRKMAGETLGRKIELEEKIDPGLIGGFILRVGDRQIDQSIKSKLQKLEQEFKL
jgi:F-type H+-transporting ATPase subunit delta